MRRVWKWLAVGLGVIGAVIVVVVVVGVLAVLVLTQTDYGRERVRQLAVGGINGATHGIAHIGAVHGNLLAGVVLSDVTLTDSAGKPFVAADTVKATYRLRPFFSKKVILSSLTLVRPVIVLDKPPGGSWNWDRILFPPSPEHDTTAGWGSWIRLHQVRIVDGTLVTRSPWTPRASLVGAARDSAIQEALSPSARTVVVPVPGGYQQVMTFRSMNGTFPRIRLADPDTATKLIAVSNLSMTANMFRPPPLQLRDAGGIIRVAKDSAWWRDLHVTLPNSRATLSGAYLLASGDFRVHGHADPAALADLRWIYPPFPSTGSGSLDFAMATHHDSASDYSLQHARFAVGDATLSGDATFSMGDTTRVSNTHLRFARVSARLLEQLVPGLHIPRRGSFSGQAALDGSVGDMRLSADVEFAENPTGQVSHLVADGGVGMAGGFHADSLHLRLEPLQLDLARIAAPKLPLRGTLTGRAMLDGAASTGLAFRTQLALTDHGAVSQVAGGGTVALGGRRPRANVKARFTPLALVTAGRFAPSLGLHGAARGTASAHGTLRDLAVQAHLSLPDSAQLLAEGTVDLSGRVPEYDLTAQLDHVRPRTVAAVGPPATLTGVVSARGRGYDPAHMSAAIAASLSSSTLDSIALDTAHARLTIADGMATVDTLLVRTSFGEARSSGTLGLAAGHAGTLQYRIRLDSLAALRRFLPTDTGIVAPRPAVVSRALAKARADSARVAKATEVERAATGSPLPPVPTPKVAALSRGAVAGSLYTVGTVRGEIRDFGVRGRLALADLIVRGNFVNRGTMEYALVDAGTPRMAIVAGATLDSVQASGFALDSVALRLAYRQPGGTAAVTVFQDSVRAYHARADFAMDSAHTLVHLQQLAMQFGRLRWDATQPATIAWGRTGVDVDSVDITNGQGGRIFVNGHLPVAGASSLDVQVRALPLANVTALLESAAPVSGLLSLTAHVEGTERSPQFTGSATLAHAAYGGTPVPTVQATFRYADTRLQAIADVVDSTGERLATASGTLPIDLAIAGYSGPRLLNEPLSFNLRAEDLPLAGLSHVSPDADNIHGRVVAAVSVRGTAQHPTIEGAIGLDNGAVRIVPLGITLQGLTGTLHMDGDTLVVDSLVARTVGTVRLAGRIILAHPKTPSFALTMLADNATVLDNEDGRITMDGKIGMHGPFDGVSITGNADVLNGIYYLPPAGETAPISLADSVIYNVIDTTVAAERDLLPSPSPLLENLSVNVELNVSRDTWVRTPDANVEIYSTGPLTVRLGQRSRALTVEGVINTNQGDYTFLGRRFVLARGSATFIGAPEIDPILQLTGQRDVQLAGQGTQAINIVIGGTLRQPRVTLASNAQPPIPQEQLLSYLAFGQSTSSLLQQEGSSSLSGQGGANGRIIGQVAAVATRQLAAIALGTLTDEFEETAARSLGADVLNITPADIPAEVSLNGVAGVLRGTQVEAGKYVDARTFVGIQVRPTFVAPGARIQYRAPMGLQWQMSLEPRFLLREPTLSTNQTPRATSVFGMFVLGDWRF